MAIAPRTSDKVIRWETSIDVERQVKVSGWETRADQTRMDSRGYPRGRGPQNAAAHGCRVRRSRGCRRHLAFNQSTCYFHQPTHDPWSETIVVSGGMHSPRGQPWLCFDRFAGARGSGTRNVKRSKRNGRSVSPRLLRSTWCFGVDPDPCKGTHEGFGSVTLDGLQLKPP